MTALDKYLEAVCVCAHQAARVHGPLVSVEQGYGLLLEEIDEYFDEVRRKEADRDPARLRLELVDVGCVALRLCVNHGLDPERVLEQVESNVLNKPVPRQLPHATYGSLIRHAQAFGNPALGIWDSAWLELILTIAAHGYLAEDKPS